ncbi:MAG: hypothetical protein RBR96_05890 [Candidatus Izemoplasmatales bacterium]|nr:hypothetical protein [Candidatus Izemoplasmatales bacterium]
MKKLLSAFVVMFLVLALLGCNAAGPAINKLENEGYVVESGDQEEMDEFKEEYGIEALANVHIIKKSEDAISPSGIIFEFESAKVLEAEMLEEGEKAEDYEDFIYKNLWIISFELLDLDNIIDIIKG